jgi:hypothetical protein
VDVVVVGGGSSGAAAALVAAREGASVLLVELNPGLGGTGTYGGVDSYWFGRRDGYVAEVRDAVRATHRRLCLPRRGGKWNVTAKAHTWERLVTGAGAEIWYDATTVGAILQPPADHPGGVRRVCGVVVATGGGVVGVRGRVVVDASGDGDVAAFAGAGYRYGGERGAVMWYSLAQFAEPGRSRNNFGGAVDVSDVEDYTRAVLAGRRRGLEGDGVHDHGSYVATRESRHVEGDVTVTLDDQLSGRRWPDTVNVHFSNHDIKGRSGSRWSLSGLVPPNLLIEVPYRALLPRGLDGILVVGKAFSATHDGIAAIRMQADLENLGGVAGLAAATAARAGTGPRGLDVPALRRRLADDGLLPADGPAGPDGPDGPDEPDRAGPVADPAALVDDVARHVPLYAYSDMGHRKVHRSGIPFVTAVRSDDPAMDGALATGLDRYDGLARIVLAQALALRHDQRGVDVLVAELTAALHGELPRQGGHIRNAQLPPDQAAMPDAAYLLYTLAYARSERALPVWRRVAELLAPAPAALTDAAAGVFAYVDAVCLGAELLADPRAAETLRAIHALPNLHGQRRTGGCGADFVQERWAMLELALGRALLRCGSPLGAEILAGYLDDVRALFVRFAGESLGGGTSGAGQLLVAPAR